MTDSVRSDRRLVVARSARASSQSEVKNRRFSAVYSVIPMFRKRSFAVTASLRQRWRGHSRFSAIQNLVGLLDSTSNSPVVSWARAGVAATHRIEFTTSTAWFRTTLRAVGQRHLFLVATSCVLVREGVRGARRPMNAKPNKAQHHAHCGSLHRR
jgi:hypothetical protein